jgi:hypothetical protein
MKAGGAKIRNLQWLLGKMTGQSEILQPLAALATALLGLSSEAVRHKLARSLWSGRASEPRDCSGQGLASCGEYELAGLGEMPAQLSSNDGESALILGLEDPCSYATDAGFESSIGITGRHWDGDHTHQIELSVQGIWLRQDDLLALREALRMWLARPLHELTPESLSGEFQLARLPGQAALIRFGERPDVDDRRNPIVTVSLAAGGFSGEVHFPTDQSCLEAFHRQLGSRLEGAG